MIIKIRGIKSRIDTGLKTSSLSFKRREDAIYVYLCQPDCIIRKLFLDLCDTQDRPESCVGQHKRHILGIIKGGICNHDAEWIILAMVGKILSHGGRTFGMRGLVTLLDECLVWYENAEWSFFFFFRWAILDYEYLHFGINNITFRCHSLILQYIIFKIWI